MCGNILKQNYQNKLKEVIYIEINSCRSRKNNIKGVAMKRIAIIFFIMLFSGYAFCQNINNPDKVINQENEVQSSEKTQDIKAVTSDESKTASESRKSESLASKIASVAEKTANATNGVPIVCGASAHTLPGAILCVGVDTINLLSSGIASFLRRGSSDTTESSYP